MDLNDPRYADFPPEVSVDQLRWMIHHVAEGQVPVEELIENFRKLHEAIEDTGRPNYKTKEEARMIWDVLWSLEFYSTDRLKEKHPFEWNDAADVLAVVQRVSGELKGL